MKYIQKICIIILFVILFLFMLRQIKYNYYLKNLKTINEHFIGSNKSSTNLDYKELSELPTNPAIVYQDIFGNFYIIDGNNIWIKNKTIVKNKLKDVFNIKDDIYIEKGFYDHLKKNIYFISKNIIYIYNLTKHKIIKKEHICSYYNLDKKYKNIYINAICLYIDKIYVFYDKYKLLTIDYKTNRFLKSQKAQVVFKDCPNRITCAFVNHYNCIRGNPFGNIVFIKNDMIFNYNEEEQRVEKGISLKKGLSYNKSLILLDTNKKNFKIDETGYYRIILVGAGMINSGKGGMVSNDYFLKKNEKLDYILGTSGSRVPVKGKESKNKLEEAYTSILHYNGSTSGSGGSFLLKNNKLLMASGGGGGWSSELVSPPNITNSVEYNLRENGNNSINSINNEYHLPIKKLIIVSEKGNENMYYKIAVKTFNIEILNNNIFKYDVTIYPEALENNINSKYIYETNYSNSNTQSRIEIIFDEPIIDYKIELIYDILSTHTNNDFKNSRLIIIDEQYRNYVLDNFDKLFNYKYITAKNIYKFLNYNLPKKLTKNHKFVFSGNDKFHSIKKLVDDFDEFNYLDPNDKPGTSQYMKLKGGLGGGGHTIGDRKIYNIFSGGGGGYIGGKSCLMYKKNKIDYSAGVGGTSYIDKLNYDNKWHHLLEYCFINNLNDSSGYMIILKLKNKTFKKSSLKDILLKDNTQLDNNNNKNKKNKNKKITKSNNIFFDLSNQFETINK